MAALRAQIKLVIVLIMISFAVISINCVSSNQKSMNDSTAQPTNVQIVPVATVIGDNTNIEPTSITIQATPDTMATGSWSTVTAQLYYNGELLKKRNVNLTFQSSAVFLANFPRNWQITNDSGSASMDLIPNSTPGQVTITVFYNGSRGVVSNSTLVEIARSGTISGLVRDKNGTGVWLANVSLYCCTYNNTSKKWENGGLAYVLPDNPQFTRDSQSSPSGLYSFVFVQAGDYNLTVEKNGHMNFSIVHVTDGDETCFITLSDYTFISPDPTTADKLEVPTRLDGCTIWGIVSDGVRQSFTNVKVTLWYSIYNSSTGEWEKGKMVDASNNPQYTNNGDTGMIGEYRFDNLQKGNYYIMAETPYQRWPDNSSYAIVHLNDSLAIEFLAIPTTIIMDATPTPVGWTPTPQHWRMPLPTPSRQ
jgi:hypothetical protein